MKKFIGLFAIILLASITSIYIAFSVADWYKTKNDRLMTVKALQLIEDDLRQDTALYHLRIDKILKRNVEYLKLGFKNELKVDELKKLHKGLRSSAESKVYNFGYEYLQNHVSNPVLKNDSMLMWIGYYYELSSPEGNYGRWNASFRKIVDENYQQLFKVFPNFFHADTVVAHGEMREKIRSFQEDSYWQGRIRLTHREVTSLMLPIFEKNLGFAEDLLRLIDEELSKK